MAAQLSELLLQSLEHEKGGVLVYKTALRCVVNPDLRSEWERYLEETRKHERVLAAVCERLGIDPNEETPGRKIVRHLGSALVQAMELALEAGNADAAQLVACECVVLAETKDHLDWQLIGKCAEKYVGAETNVLRQAYDEIEDQEDEHLYHSKGWPGALDRVTRHESRAATTGRSEGREDGHWRGQGRAGQRASALTCRNQLIPTRDSALAGP